MSAKNAAEPDRRVLASRSSASRRLLARKASEKNSQMHTGAPLEASFPSVAGAGHVDRGQVGTSAPRIQRALSQQKVRVGDIQPNANTVPAVIAAIVAVRGEVSRAELLDIMRDSSFPHPAARPRNTSWCQGYLAGAIRSGFLAVVSEPAVPSSADQA